MSRDRDLRFIRRWIVLFMIALAFFGLTAVPLEWGTQQLVRLTAPLGGTPATWSAHVAEAIADVGSRHPILFYGTDWLAFAHLVIALAFVGVLRDPVRNTWIVEWGLWMCLLSVLFAFAWAPVRGIPFFWRCVDASFGIVGAVPLWLVLQRIKVLEGSGQR